MTDSEIKQIADIAMSAKSTIKLSELATILGTGNVRGAASKVSAAWKYYYNNGQRNISFKIETTYVDENGEFAYVKYKN